MTNLQEFTRGTRANLADTDGDGLSDLVETNTGTYVSPTNTGTNPMKADTDGDGLRDGVETKTGIYVNSSNTGTDPLKADTDGDGLSDSVENNSGTFVSAANPGTNPNKADTDGDSWNDAAESQFGSNPNLAASVPSLNPAGLDILAWWPFNDSSKPAVTTDAIHSFDASLVNGAVYSADAAGRTGAAGDMALDLSAGAGAQAARLLNAQWLNLAAPADQLAVSFWQNLVAVSNSSALWITSPSSNNGQRGFQAHTTWGDGNVYFDTAGCCDPPQRISGPLFEPDGITHVDLTASWHHIVVQKKGPDKEVWVDGVLQVSGTDAAPLPSDPTNLYIGSAPESGSMVGLLDDFAIFGDALTEEQIGRLAAGESPTALLGPPPALAITNVVFNAPTHSIQLTWHSQAGAIYTLEGTTDLGTGHWVEVNDNIASAGASTEYTYDVNTFPPGGATPQKLFLRVKKN